MATYKIFESEVGTGSNLDVYEVWLTDGQLQFVVDGQIRHDIDSVTDFLISAAKKINTGNNDDTIVKSSGSVADKAVENFEGGHGVALDDKNGTNPSISIQGDGTEVKISGGGVGGNLRIDFGGPSGKTTSEVNAFVEFANDLLGKTGITQQEVLTGVQIGDYTRTVTVSTRDDDVHQIKFKSTGDKKDLGWADAYIDDIAMTQFGGTKIQDGNVGEGNYTANQIHIESDPTQVDLGSNGVGGKEVWQFENANTALDFLNAIQSEFGSGADWDQIIDDAIESIADDLGGTQTRNGNVAEDYTAKQIRLTGDDKNIVDLGSHKVGGKETYEFDDQATAQEFIDKVRDAVGVEGHEGPLVQEYVYQVSGGAGISGSPRFVSKDAFIEFIGEEFGGTLKRDGGVSESFDGGAKLVGDDLSDVQLGPRGVGGKEVWDFADQATAEAFKATLDDIFS
ncbi:MAG: hypothetical protein AAGD34_10215 [Pseudomonadota bacterium]